MDDLYANRYVCRGNHNNGYCGRKIQIVLKKLSTLVILLSSFPALGQTVQQSGTVTARHLPYWVTSGVIADGGSATDSPITSIGVTNNGAGGLCVASDRQSSAGRN